ncbi:MAG TPA: 1,4-alpha-glucan branching protein GlgB [Candidatus Cottocaccamicrobium excrementipullorum]|nr:1,4-alpha-glucan branching protein GlgB [Candidatus Cottocaccamicrobium excrementipullorum]
MDFYDFYTGQEFEAYTYLGAHIVQDGVVFRTFAPNAIKVSVIGEFSDWQEIEMEKTYDGNFWERTVNNARQGMKYKYRIYDQKGKFLDHCDPYGFYSELRPGTASVIYGLSNKGASDQVYLRQRKNTEKDPLNIYELHAGSWKKPENDPEGFYGYRELADLLVPYLIRNHYNYVELMPLNEYPCDESWGYQATGFFSPTSRYGTPDDLRYFIDQCHKEKIGVILDFVSVHFAVNDYALLKYDGTALYEYPHHDVGINEWGSCNFMHSRGEVRSFLQSAAYYWLKEFHFDGLRVDAVSNLIYWQGDKRRGENQGAIRFLRTMNEGLKKRCPGAILIAEDSSDYSGVTSPTENGGLGFDYKWDLGWMNDTLSYLQLSPEERKEQYHKLTFSMMYFPHEHYLLPLSHDEVVHGKASILQKMNGDVYEDKFAQARLLYMYMFAHPGKKLNFMGNEIGMFREWNEKTSLDWNLLAYPQHEKFYHFIRKLNSLYLQCPALFREDYEQDGFEWLDCENPDYAAYAFLRKGENQEILAVLNFDDTDLHDYQIRLPKKRKAVLLLDSSDEIWGGTNGEKGGSILQENRLRMNVPRFSGQYFLLTEE